MAAASWSRFACACGSTGPCDTDFFLLPLLVPAVALLSDACAACFNLFPRVVQYDCKDDCISFAFAIVVAASSNTANRSCPITVSWDEEEDEDGKEEEEVGGEAAAIDSVEEVLEVGDDKDGTCWCPC